MYCNFIAAKHGKYGRCELSCMLMGCDFINAGYGRYVLSSGTCWCSSRMSYVYCEIVECGNR